MRKLTEAEAHLLTEARWLLTDLGNAAQEDSFQSYDAYRLGCIYTACETAENAVFQVLNCQSAYFDDPEAERVLHLRREDVAV